MSKVGDSKSSKGIPRKARSASRKARRAKNLAGQPRKKLTHILKRNGIRAAFEWADERSHLSTLRQLRPEYAAELREAGLK